MSSEPHEPGALREVALALLETAVQAVEPSRLVREALPGHLPHHGHIRLIAVGKAADGMTRGALEVLGPERIHAGVLVAPEAPTRDLPPTIRSFPADHPIPSKANVAAARAVRDVAAGAGEEDQVLLLLSGGGSALLTLPANGLGLEDVRRTTRHLMRAGAEIGELNAVRKRLDVLKGGGLARAAAPARVLALVLSDVVGDSLDVIASGPVSPDSSGYREALEVLARLDPHREVPEAVRRHLEAGAGGERPEPPGEGDPCFRRVQVEVVGNGRVAAEALMAEARRRGYAPLLLTTRLTGEAREVGAVLAAMGSEVRRTGHPLPPPACLVAAGETTVTVRGAGVGGRNQELALGAAVALDGAKGVVLASLGTDGIDGPTDAAGAMVDGDTLRRARELGLDPRAALTTNDSHRFFDLLGDLIRTGPTGTNVADLQVVLVG
ncbi:MAG: glycerate kinase [Gemmatimonadota bacterium]